MTIPITYAFQTDILSFRKCDIVVGNVDFPLFLVRFPEVFVQVFVGFFFSFEGLTEGEADGVTDCRKEGRVRACVRAGLEAETVLRSQARCVYSERFHLWLGFLPRSLLAS